MEKQKLQIREIIHAKRQALPSETIKSTARLIEQQLQDSDLFRDKQNIAFYMAHNGEIDPCHLLESALQAGKNCYLPVLHTDEAQPLSFIRYDKDSPLRTNRYGIPEPIAQEGNSIPAEDLDIVFTPLIAFDKQLNRLGMGMGYYDRSFAFLKNTQAKKTMLIGLAYDFQYHEHIPIESWDVPLSQVVTEKKIYRSEPKSTT